MPLVDVDAIGVEVGVAEFVGEHAGVLPDRLHRSLPACTGPMRADPQRERRRSSVAAVTAEGSTSPGFCG